MTMTPGELESMLSSIGEPPEVSHLLNGSGVNESFNNMQCDQVDCEYITDLMSAVQRWLDDAQEILDELDAYTDSGELKLVLNEAELGKRNAENTGQDPSAYDRILNEAQDLKTKADQLYKDLHNVKRSEAYAKRLLEKTHYHCCEENRRWHNFFHKAD